MNRSLLAIGIFGALALTAAPLGAQEAAADSAVADTAAADTTAAADSPPADTSAAGEATASEPGEVPSLEGYRKIAILWRDMSPAAPGYETAVEVHRAAGGAQVLRFVTRGTPWGLVVRAAADAEPYTLRDFDCSGGFTEQLQAGTPLAIPDCAMPEAPPAPADEDDD